MAQSNDVKLGEIIGEPDEAKRDAIHIAVAPVIAGDKLSPGQDVGFLDAERTKVGCVNEPIGIVDPFLKHMVFPEQRIYIMLYPNTITGLRHDWHHPAFAKATHTKEESWKWMRECAAQHANGWGDDNSPFTAEELMEHAKNFLETGDRFVQVGSDTL